MNPKDRIKELIVGNQLPCYVYSRKPFILFAYDYDFVNRIPAFKAALPQDEPVHLFLQIGWQVELPEDADRFVHLLGYAIQAIPNLRVTVFANNKPEAAGLRERGVNALYCHQNAFLDERNYRILPNMPKTFDAIYIARITPFKRHHLAAKIPTLRFIGDYYDREQEYFDGILKLIPQAKWGRNVPGSLIYRDINRAHTGLCLSALEGAMFVSVEYLLCGLPVINTDNVGGRDLTIPPFAMKRVPADADAVAEAAREWKAAPPPPQEIRQATLELFTPHRLKFHELLSAVFDEAGRSPAKLPPLPHKLGLRCFRMPWVNWRHGLTAKK